MDHETPDQQQLDRGGGACVNDDTPNTTGDDALRHTPGMTRFVQLPNVHERSLQALLLDSVTASRSHELPRRVRSRQEQSASPAAAAAHAAKRRSRSKSLGNEHERIIAASHAGYRDAEDAIRKSQSYGGVGTTTAAPTESYRGGLREYVLSKYGRNEAVPVHEYVLPLKESAGAADESTHLLDGEGADAETGRTDRATSVDDTYSITYIPNPPSMSIAYGLINAAIVLPVLISFGSIIYHDGFFRPYLPTLVKLTVVSGFVHQICFSTFSSLPFAIGQVQDAGLIFLSKIASDMVARCKESGEDDETILATVTVGLGLCTAVLGVVLVIIGKFDLASIVTLLPTPCVGGYLAYIGFFCGQGGLSISAGIEVSSLFGWGVFFQKDVFVLIVPAIFCGIFVYVSIRRLGHMAVLPCCIVGMIVVFYIVLLATGTTLEEARESGWVSKAESAPAWDRTWDYIQFDKVVWNVLPAQIPTLIGMTAVVALSSSLDVAAIEVELKRPLNYNKELSTVGISNVISGMTGGYTGSYIFSQSIFSLRAGIRSRLSGYILALSEAIVFVLPINILSYVPLFFFGSLLVMICIDLIVEWLWEVRLKMTRAAYVDTVLTFLLIMALGVEWGILAGIGVYFALSRFGLEMTTSIDDTVNTAVEIEGVDNDRLKTEMTNETFLINKK